MKYDPFVIPFTAGLIFLVGYLLVKYTRWIKALDPADKQKLKKGLVSMKSLHAIKEVFFESLIHRKVFRINPFLGFMHLSFAFGWFLLIVIGNLECRLYSKVSLNPPYVPIFSKFFERYPGNFFLEREISFIMDFILLVILIGVGLAMVKRFYSGLFGMKKTTKLRIGDKLALYSLWLIFPLRLLAESLISGVFHSGDFLTGSLGDVFASFLPVSNLYYPAYVAYSTALGLFFVSLPFSRYMHIPTEVLLIFVRNYGIKSKKAGDPYAEMEVHSCSRCGICIDKCQLATVSGIEKLQSVYFIRSIRFNEVTDHVLHDCLVCGRCKEACPVGIDTNSLRLHQREKHENHGGQDYSYLKEASNKKTDVLYFAGCMGHLTPTVKKSMIRILNESGVKYRFMDENGSICCGRPLMLAGKTGDAMQLVKKNKEIIERSGAHTLVTSCPICYKVFSEEYKLNIKVVHHTQFLFELANEGLIKLKPLSKRVVYHDPCELGRGAGIYEIPRQLISKIATLQPAENEKEGANCCGGSLGSLGISSKQRREVKEIALKNLIASNPDELITACPLCKKTFASGSEVIVRDIAELVSESLVSFQSSGKTEKEKVNVLYAC